MKKLPTVAIIGQTNAGKSSLFNRMTRSRQAIVAKEEGTTRDNVMARVATAKGAFWLVDTAGLKDPEDEFEASIQDQIADAVENADLILVAMDATKYPNQDDKDIAKKALKSRKPVVLILNKCDLKGNLAEEEFLRLGVKDRVRVSAEHGTGVKELKELIGELIDLSGAQVKDEDVLKIALIGRPNVGKSSLFNVMAKKQQAIVANVSGTTRDLNRVKIKFEKVALEIIDTAGVRRPGKQEVGVEKFSVLRTMQAIEEADVCCLLVDGTEPRSAFDQRLAGIIDKVGKGMIIVVTKWDLVDASEEGVTDKILAGMTRDFNFAPYAPVVLTSSVDGKNVTKIFELALKIREERKREFKTSELNRVLAQAILSHPPAGLKNKHPKLRYMVQTDTSPPWFVVYGRHLSFLHWSYKRYLENIFRETFGFEGTPIKFSFRDEKTQTGRKPKAEEGGEERVRTNWRGEKKKKG
ncbi:ribosome biogenesis GTPase Der [Candidatus Saccharibacteria bacterium]|nr:ribosome biogenesis GTPase Der [Candidatus Saccharibacteria bacterium]